MSGNAVSMIEKPHRRALPRINMLFLEAIGLGLLAIGGYLPF